MILYIYIRVDFTYRLNKILIMHNKLLFITYRSFSLYTYILSNRRYNFKEHKLEMYLIINFNSEK